MLKKEIHNKGKNLNLKQNHFRMYADNLSANMILKVTFRTTLYKKTCRFYRTAKNISLSQCLTPIL